VNTLFAAWLAVQNGSNFAGYEGLYGERFTGVKRALGGTRSFGRAGWLADRKAMFEKPMKVGASDVRITLSGTTARVHFQQAWSSGTYADTGPKQLLVASTPQGVRIVREEMISSKIASVPAQTSLSNLILADEDGLVLETKPDDRWSKGDVHPGRNKLVATTAVDESALPAEFSSWKGRSVRAVTKTGSICTATVTSFAIRTAVVPHFAMFEDWHGRFDSPVLTKEAIAKEIWKLGADRGRTLVGVLSPTCDALWALPADRAAPAPGTLLPAGADLTALGIQALRKLPRHADLQREYLKVAGAKGPWDAIPEAVVRAFTLELPSGPKLLHVAASAMPGGCDGFVGELDAVFAVGPGESPKLTVVGVPESANGSTWTPESVFDLDGDGSLEILFGGGFSRTRALYAKGTKGYELRVLFEEPYFDCPC
jgi:hypothetical protein